MSPAEQAPAVSPAPETETRETDLLEEIMKATRNAQAQAQAQAEPRTRTEELVKALVGEALKGTVTWEKSVTKTITDGMKAIDEAISKQLAAIMHNPEF